MKRMLLLFAVATLATSLPAAAQNVRTDVTTAQRPAIDTAAIARALRDRGVPDNEIAASMPRIRYWLSLGASPARIRAFLNQQNGDRPDVRRPDAARPETPVARGPVTRPIDRPVTRGPVVARPNDVQRADTARLTPRTVRPAATRPLAGN
jgi:hypothetical protein